VPPCGAAHTACDTTQTCQRVTNHGHFRARLQRRNRSYDQKCRQIPANAPRNLLFSVARSVLMLKNVNGDDHSPRSFK
jgi:hypothetical protein